MIKSKIFLYLCLSFVVGVFLSSIFGISQLFILGVLIFSLVIFSIPPFFKKARLVIFGFCLLSFLLGIWRYQSFRLRIENNELKNYINQEIDFTAIISNQPAQKEKTSRIEVQPQEIQGKILITSSKYPEYEYGDKVKIIGKLEEPPVFEDFNYKDYLAKNGIYALMFFPKIELLEKGFGSSAIKNLFYFKKQLKQGVDKAITFPQSGLLAGLMFGDEDDVSKEWLEKFNLTGTRHITAVSGMNITIISVLVLNFLLILGLWRRQAFYLSIIFIIFFILMIGAPASAIRAGIMGIMFLTAQYLGRASSASRVIIFSASLMLFFNPLLITDIGFQLSFLAVMGLIYLQPFFMRLFKKAPDAFEFRYTLSATLAAQSFVLPILIYNFGQIPLTGPFANILIVPLLSIITILGFIISFLAIFSPLLALILSFPVWLMLSYILKIVDFAFKLPYTSLMIENISWVWVLVFYLILGFSLWRLQEKQRLKFLE